MDSRFAIWNWDPLDGKLSLGDFLSSNKVSSPATDSAISYDPRDVAGLPRSSDLTYLWCFLFVGICWAI